MKSNFRYFRFGSTGPVGFAVLVPIAAVFYFFVACYKAWRFLSGHPASELSTINYQPSTFWERPMKGSFTPVELPPRSGRRAPDLDVFDSTMVIRNVCPQIENRKAKLENRTRRLRR